MKYVTLKRWGCTGKRCGMLRGGVWDVVVIVTFDIKKTVTAYISKRNNKANRQSSQFDSLVDTSLCLCRAAWVEWLYGERHLATTTA